MNTIQMCFEHLNIKFRYNYYCRIVLWNLIMSDLYVARLFLYRHVYLKLYIYWTPAINYLFLQIKCIDNQYLYALDSLYHPESLAVYFHFFLKNSNLVHVRELTPTSSLSNIHVLFCIWMHLCTLNDASTMTKQHGICRWTLAIFRIHKDLRVFPHCIWVSLGVPDACSVDILWLTVVITYHHIR